MKIEAIYIDKELLEELLEGARLTHPREVILLLRGKKVRVQDAIKIFLESYLVPPLPIHGRGFASYRLSMLPFYPDIVGTFHSHPSGCPKPSIVDLNNFIGLFVAIAIYPYKSINDIFAYDKNANPIQFKLKT